MKARCMKRYHIELGTNRGNSAAEAIAAAVEGAVISNTERYNAAGNDMAIINVPAAHAAELETLLDEDENVIEYRAYDAAAFES